MKDQDKANNNTKAETGGLNQMQRITDREEKYVTFYMDSEEYALPVSDVREIIRAGDTTEVPNTSEHIMGVINLRGKVLSVIDLKKMLSLGKTKTNKDSRIIIVETGIGIKGLLVDRVYQVLNVLPDQIKTPPEDISGRLSRYCEKIGIIDENRFVIIINLKKFFQQNKSTI